MSLRLEQPRALSTPAPAAHGVLNARQQYIAAVPEGEAPCPQKVSDDYATIRAVSQVQHVFLDDGGVMNDNRLRGPQWERLVGDFFAPRLGGTKAAWAKANRRVLEGVYQRMFGRWANWDEATQDYVATYRESEADWLLSMCREVPVPIPDAASAFALASEAGDWIEPQVEATLPGAMGAIRILSQTYILYTASMGTSWELRARLNAQGVESLFRSLYGPDLLNVPKTGKRYYERLFEHAGVDSAHCLVLDDKPEFLDHARALGAQTLQVGGEVTASHGHAVIATLADLPMAIGKI